MLELRQVSEILDIVTSHSELLCDWEVERAWRVDEAIVVLARRQIMGTKNVIPRAVLLLDHVLRTKAWSAVCDVNT